MGALGDTIGRYLPLARKKPKIDRAQALAVIPVRNPVVDWELRDKEAVLTIPLPETTLAKVVKRLVPKLPETRQLVLDEVGASVWDLCDGERNLNVIVDCVSRKYKLTRRETEASVTMFLQTLAKRKLIGLMSGGGSNRVNRKRK